MATLQLYIPEQGLPAEGEVMIRFAQRSKTGELLKSGEMPLSELPRGDRVEALLPASAVLCTEVKLPPVRGQRLRQMLPFAIEEKLLTDPETMHVAAGPRQLSGLTPVVAVEKRWLQGVVEHLQRAGLRPDSVLTEIALPDLDPNAWTMVWNGHDGFVRTGPHLGLPLDAGDEHGIPFGLVQAVAEAKVATATPERIILRPYGENPVPDLEQWSERLGVPVVRGQDWEWAPRFANLDSALNLLQGDFTPFANLRELVPRLKPIWAMAALILVVQVLATAVDWWSLNRQKRATISEMEKNFKQLFPDARVVDPPLQLQRKVAELRRAAGQAEDNDFLPLLGKGVDLLATAPGSKLESMRYEGGILKLDVLLPNDSAVEALRSATKQPAVRAKVEATTPKAGGVSARLTLGES